MAHINIVVDGGFKQDELKKVQFAYKIQQVKNSLADFVYAPPGRINAGSFTREYNKKLGNRKLAAEVAELNGVVAALEAVDDIRNGYYMYPVEKTTVFIDSKDALRDIENCRHGIIKPIDNSYADRCRVELLVKIQTLIKPSLTRFRVDFEKVDAHRTPSQWQVPEGMSPEEFQDVMTMHAAVDSWVHAERNKEM